MTSHYLWLLFTIISIKTYTQTSHLRSLTPSLTIVTSLSFIKLYHLIYEKIRTQDFFLPSVNFLGKRWSFCFALIVFKIPLNPPCVTSFADDFWTNNILMTLRQTSRISPGSHLNTSQILELVSRDWQLECYNNFDVDN